MLAIKISFCKYGENNGNVLIKTVDKELKCHDFVITQTSIYMREILENKITNNIIELDSNYEVVNIILNYLYSEKVIDKDLNANDIIKLYHLINQLKCPDTIIVLKHYYLEKFAKTINENNWNILLKMVFGISKFSNLQ